MKSGIITPMDPTGQPSRLVQPTLLRRAWEGFLQFLRIIGLRSESGADLDATVARLKLFHTEFRKLLSANDSFLTTLAELEGLKPGMDCIEVQSIRRKVVRAVADLHRMVESLNVIGEGRYHGLETSLDRAESALGRTIEEPDREAVGLVLDLQAITADHEEWVGGKMANLGEIVNVVGLRAPDGFATTTEAYRLFLDEAGIGSVIQQVHADIRSESDVARVSLAAREAIFSARMPPHLAGAVFDAYERLCERLVGRRPGLAVRSSAVGEDGLRSFAGQFSTELNRGRDELPDAWRRVVASLYSEEAVHYRLMHGMDGASARMAVGFVEMVDPIASGIAYTRDPADPGRAGVLIHAVEGLGSTLADGGTPREVITVARRGDTQAIERETLAQSAVAKCSSSGGIRTVDVIDSAAFSGGVTDDEARQIARAALALETHFGVPQDVEWAIDQGRRPWYLQSRRLRVASPVLPAVSPPELPEPIVAGGDCACPGAGAGQAVRMDEDGDFDSFPAGGVLVARRPSPRFVRLMSRAAAIVTDAGSTTGHMASLAREFRVPTLLNTGSATGSIPAGSTVTVDAGACRVYPGRIVELFEGLRAAGHACEDSSRPRTRGERLLESSLAALAPLNLTDPGAPSFRAENCVTLHDIARFVHEKSYEEMFCLGERFGDFRSASRKLDVALPVDIYVIDLGGGVASRPSGMPLLQEDVLSAPLAAVLRGMLDPALPATGPRPLDARGLLDIMARHAMTSPEEERTFRDPSYAMVSDAYLNYTARVGYHFAVVDTYCGETPNRNYVSFRFHGGAADPVRRGRRARAISAILRESGFAVEVRGDLVSARMARTPSDETERHLEILGRLLQYSRQMDAAMVDEESVRRFEEAFRHL